MNIPSQSHPDVCRRCAEKSRTCCAVASGDEEYCFPISVAEMNSIRNSGQGGAECFVSAPNTSGFVQQMSALVPDRDVEAAFPPEGSHWRLATTSDGRCVFLRENGCVLERGVRPLYCRLFPLWYFEGHLTWFTAEDCLAHEECGSLADMLEVMHTDSAEARALHREMCTLLGLERREKVK